jgi:hypothetical protein
MVVCMYPVIRTKWKYTFVYREISLLKMNCGCRICHILHVYWHKRLLFSFFMNVYFNVFSTLPKWSNMFKISDNIFTVFCFIILITTRHFGFRNPLCASDQKHKKWVVYALTQTSDIFAKYLPANILNVSLPVFKSSKIAVLVTNML